MPIDLIFQVILTLIVLGALLWAVRTIIPLLGLPAPVTTVVYVLLVLLCVLYLVDVLGGFSGHHGLLRVGSLA